MSTVDFENSYFDPIGKRYKTATKLNVDGYVYDGIELKFVLSNDGVWLESDVWVEVVKVGGEGELWVERVATEADYPLEMII